MPEELLLSSSSSDDESYQPISYPDTDEQSGSDTHLEEATVRPDTVAALEDATVAAGCESKDTSEPPVGEDGELAASKSDATGCELIKEDCRRGRRGAFLAVCCCRDEVMTECISLRARCASLETEKEKPIAEHAVREECDRVKNETLKQMNEVLQAELDDCVTESLQDTKVCLCAVSLCLCAHAFA